VREERRGRPQEVLPKLADQLASVQQDAVDELVDRGVALVVTCEEGADTLRHRDGGEDFHDRPLAHGYPIPPAGALQNVVVRSARTGRGSCVRRSGSSRVERLGDFARDADLLDHDVFGS